MSRNNETRKVQAFDALGKEFDRVAARDAIKRVSRGRRTLIVAALFVVAPVTTVAVASLDGDGAAPIEVPGASTSGEPVEGPPEAGSGGGGSINVIGDTAPQQLVERCEKDANATPSCDLVLAIDASEIAPGRYTDEELEQALIAAGYDGDF